MTNKSRITSLAVLRGVAVLAVCFCHLGKPASTGLVMPGLFKWLEEYGQFGVQIFFVISGFVIPYSLHQAKYTIKDYFLFLYKRFLRLHPPYLVALAFTLVLAAVSYKSRHLSNPETPLTIFQSLFYIHAPADNPVFWTLRVEAEYYLFIGLYFVLMQKFPRLSMLFCLPLFLWASQTPLAIHIELFQYIVYFLMGTVGYQIYISNKNQVIEYLFLILLIGFSFLYYDKHAANMATITILVILYFRKPVPAVLEFPGELSYSLYLIHFPIGIKMINLLQRHVSPAYNWLLFLLATVFCFAIAWVFWKFIEKPSAKLSGKVKYGKSRSIFANYSLKT